MKTRRSVDWDMQDQVCLMMLSLFLAVMTICMVYMFCHQVALDNDRSARSVEVRWEASHK